MRLTGLDPHFFRYETRVEPYHVIEGDPATWDQRGRPTKEVVGPRQYIIRVESFAEAQGVMFLCPKCFLQNSGPVGTHSCHVTFAGRGVLPGQGMTNSGGEPVQWEASGTCIDDLTVRPSILIVAPCGWHGFITSGEVSII